MHRGEVFLHLWVTAEQTHTQRNKQGGRQASKQTRKSAGCARRGGRGEQSFRASDLQSSEAAEMETGNTRHRQAPHAAKCPAARQDWRNASRIGWTGCAQDWRNASRIGTVVSHCNKRHITKNNRGGWFPLPVKYRCRIHLCTPLRCPSRRRRLFSICPDKTPKALESSWKHKFGRATW